MATSNATSFSNLFQSTPDLVNRENPGIRTYLQDRHRVSIHSRFS